MVELKKDFTRGQENAQDDLNTNFTEIEKNLSLETPRLFVTYPWTRKADLNKTEIGANRLYSVTGTNPDLQLPFSLDASGSITCEIPGTYRLSVSGVIQTNPQTGKYVYLTETLRNTIVLSRGGDMNYRESNASGTVMSDLKQGDKFRLKADTNITNAEITLDSLCIEIIQLTAVTSL